LQDFAQIAQVSQYCRLRNLSPIVGLEMRWLVSL